MFKPHFWLRLLLLAALLDTTPARALDFVALGDMPYGDSPAIEATYHRLIARINATRPAFSVHVGDFKSGGTECSDAAFVRQRDNFGRFDHPLVYTPGDNEWTDCHRRSNGAYAPIERLARVRQLFFGPGITLGKGPQPGLAQSESMPEFAEFVENRRWDAAGILFVTLHVVGSNNGFEARSPTSSEEFFRRDRANRAWLTAAFDRARASGARGIVVFMQADPFAARALYDDFPTWSGFRGIIVETLLPLVRDWHKPVLLVHGDEHQFRNDRPFHLDNAAVDNLFRIEVPGDRDMRAVLIHWHDQGETPFSAELLAP
jgi:hypothetical protein